MRWHNKEIVEPNVLCHTHIYIKSFRFFIETKQILFISSQACSLAQGIRDDERGGRAQIGIIDNEQESPDLMQIMTAVLGTRTGELKNAVPDEMADLQQKSNVRLYQ